MIRRKSEKRGFTLVELLVVITIIGMLMGLLIPAVTAAKNQANRVKCVSNMHQLSLAAKTFESIQQHYPGYQSTLSGGTFTGTGTSGITWAVWLMPYLDHKDVLAAVQVGFGDGRDGPDVRLPGGSTHCHGGRHGDYRSVVVPG